MACIRAFLPILPSAPQLLILGSMPSARSLQDGMYYSNPQNAFWRLLFALCEAEFSSEHAQWRALLERHGIALWDALASCEREGSLDSAIKKPRFNAVLELLSANPGIRAIACNGKLAHKHALAQLSGLFLPIYCLPSTSPANAALNFEEKLRRWAVIKPFIARPIAEFEGDCEHEQRKN